MSTTFFPEMSPITGFAFACGHGPSSDSLPYQEARDIVKARMDSHGSTGVLSGCGYPECSGELVSIVGIESDPGPHVRMSGTNAARLLRSLGLPAGLGGSEDPAVFLGRVEAAQALTPDAGYHGRRLEDLHDVAAFAVDRDRKVCWS